MAYFNWSSSVRGPVYLRQLQGGANVRSDHTILLLSDSVLPSGEALELSMRTAIREHGRLSLLHVVRTAVEQEQARVRNGLEMGDFLTSAVLRVSGGRLPPLVTVMVYIGASDDLLDFVTTTIQPTIVISSQRRRHEPASELRENIGRAQGCPVLLVPTTEPDVGHSSDRLVAPFSPEALN